MASTETVSLTNQNVLLLENAVKETRCLHQQITRQDESFSASLEELSAKIDALSENMTRQKHVSSGRKRKRTTSRPEVPRMCRREFRAMYKALTEDPKFDGFDLNSGAESQDNEQAYTRVVQTIYQDYGGAEKCPWSNEQLRGAYTTYLKTLMDTKKRNEKNGAAKHRQTCRRQGRLRNKIEHRLAALHKMQWSDSVKSEAREVLVPEYTSSDESEFSEDDGDVAVSRYRVKHLPWETTRLANLKKDLDRVHISGLSKRNKMARLPRVRQNVIGSSRPVPDDPIVWAASVIKLEATDGGHE